MCARGQSGGVSQLHAGPWLHGDDAAEPVSRITPHPVGDGDQAPGRAAHGGAAARDGERASAPDKGAAGEIVVTRRHFPEEAHGPRHLPRSVLRLAEACRSPSRNSSSGWHGPRKIRVPNLDGGGGRPRYAGNGMAKSPKPAEIPVLPMELRLGDRLADERAEWRGVGPPYSTGGGKIGHVRDGRVEKAGVTEN